MSPCPCNSGKKFKKMLFGKSEFMISKVDDI